MEAAVRPSPGGALGVFVKVDDGAMVLAYFGDGSAAARAGLDRLLGMRLTHVDGEQVQSRELLARAAVVAALNDACIVLRFAPPLPPGNNVREVEVVKHRNEVLGVRWTDRLYLADVAPGSAADRAGCGRCLNMHLTHLNSIPLCTEQELRAQRVAAGPSGMMHLRLRFIPDADADASESDANTKRQGIPYHVPLRCAGASTAPPSPVAPAKVARRRSAPVASLPPVALTSYPPPQLDAHHHPCPDALTSPATTCEPS